MVKKSHDTKNPIIRAYRALRWETDVLRLRLQPSGGIFRAYTRVYSHK